MLESLFTKKEKDKVLKLYLLYLGANAIWGAKGIAKSIAKRAKKSSSEHTKNKRPSTKGKHEKGQARKERDQDRASGKKQKGGKDGSKKRGKK